MQKIKTITVSSLAISSFLLSSSPPAFAQTSDDALLEEIIVTAEHREVSLQDTQISMTAFSEESIQELGISNGLDLFGHAPNVNVQEYQGGRSGMSFSIRGIVNAETLITFDPGVSVYMDNVLLAKNVGSQLDIAELERIEILRGPQGTLYGRNTMGGAVNYVTKKPDDEFEGRVQATLGKYGQADLRGMINVPLLGADSSLGEVNIRMSGASLSRDGVQKNLYRAPGVPKELGTVDRSVGMVHLQWLPSDDVSVLYSYDFTNIDEIPMVPWSVAANSIVAGPSVAPFVVASERDYPKTGSWDATVNTADTEVDGHALKVSWSLSDSMTLDSISAYREMVNIGSAGADGTSLPVLTTSDKQQFDAFSQEFRLIGSAMDGKVDYTAGLFYWDETGDVYNTVRAFGFPVASDAVAKYSNDAWAVYAQSTYYVSDRLSLTAGARLTEESRTMNKATLEAYLSNDPIFYDEYVKLPGSAGSVFAPASKDFDNATWLLSVGYDVSEDAMVYGKISTGFQSGGFNVRENISQRFPDGFNDENLVSYEAGIKSEWSDRIIVNAAAFFGDYTDKQVNVFDPVTLGNVRQNADAEIYGVELEALAQLSDSLRVGLGYGYLNSDFTKFNDLQGNDVSDTTNFVYAPEVTANAHIAYERSVGLGLLKARMDWTYRDDMNFLAAKPEPNASTAFHLIHGRISLDEIKGPGDSQLRLSLWGKNLANEGYWTSGVNILNSFGFAPNLWGLPRTYGLDLEVRF